MKSAEESASLARQRIDNLPLRRVMESGPSLPAAEDWRKAQGFASLVNYANAPIGAKKFEASSLGPGVRL